MRYGLEPVLFPDRDFHALFRLSHSGQDPIPVAEEFLRRAWRRRLLDKTKIVGRAATPLGHVAVLEDSRWHAFVYIAMGDKTYVSRYTLFPSLSHLRAWYELAREMGDARLMGADSHNMEPAQMIPQDPRGLRWCPSCEGVNPLPLRRCIWCRHPLSPAHRVLTAGE